MANKRNINSPSKSRKTVLIIGVIIFCVGISSMFMPLFLEKVIEIPPISNVKFDNVGVPLDLYLKFKTKGLIEGAPIRIDALAIPSPGYEVSSDTWKKFIPNISLRFPNSIALDGNYQYPQYGVMDLLSKDLKYEGHITIKYPVPGEYTVVTNENLYQYFRDENTRKWIFNPNVVTMGDSIYTFEIAHSDDSITFLQSIPYGITLIGLAITILTTARRIANQVHKVHMWFKYDLKRILLILLICTSIAVPTYFQWHDMIIHDIQPPRVVEVSYSTLTIDEMLENTPNDPKLLNNKANTFGTSPEAIVWYDKALNFDPNNTSILFNKARVLNDLYKADEALLTANKGLNVDPNNSDLLSEKAIALFQLRNFSGALDINEEALNHSPNSFALMSNKGLFLAFMNRTDDSLYWMNKSLGINPDQPRIRSLMETIQNYSKNP